MFLGHFEAKIEVFKANMGFFGLPGGIAAVSEPDFFVFEAKIVVYFLLFFTAAKKSKKDQRYRT